MSESDDDLSEGGSTSESLAVVSSEGGAQAALTRAIVEGTDRLLRLDECAAFLGLSESTIEKWVKSGVLPAYKWPKAVRVAASDLAAFAVRHHLPVADAAPSACAPFAIDVSRVRRRRATPVSAAETARAYLDERKAS